MGMDFAHASGVVPESFSINRIGWFKISNTARDYGWKPKGTLPGPFCSQGQLHDKNDYWSNSGQIVLEDDAKEMGIAVNKLLQKVRLPSIDTFPKSKFFVVYLLKFVYRCIKVLIYSHRHPRSYASVKEWEDTLSEFVDFCNQGEFAIY